MSAPELDDSGALLDEHGVLLEPIAVAGQAITIHPPTVKKPYHTIRYKIGDVRKATSGGKTFATARAKAAAITERMNTGAVSAEKPLSALVDAWLDRARARRRPWTTKTRSGYEWQVRKYLSGAIKNKACGMLTSADFQKVVNAAPTQGEGDRVKRTLSALLNYGQRNGWLVTTRDALIGDVHWVSPIPQVPVAGGGKATVTTTSAEPRVSHGLPVTTTSTSTEAGEDEQYVDPSSIPTHDKVAELSLEMLLLPNAEWWWALLPMVPAYSGVRLGEFMALKAKKVDTSQRTIRIDEQMSESAGKREITDPKGRKNRTTMFPTHTPETVWFDGRFPLAEMLGRRVRQVLADDPEGLLFPAPRGGYWSETNFYKRRFFPAAFEAGWPSEPVFDANGNPRFYKPAREQPGEPRSPEAQAAYEARIRGQLSPRQLRERERLQGPMRKLTWTWHDLRHVFCYYHGWELGVAWPTVSRCAGHANVATTLRIYASGTVSALDEMRAAGDFGPVGETSG